MIRWISCAFVIASFICVVLPGCNEKKPAADNKKESAKKEHDHDEVGPHGGPLAEWEDIYHAEFTVDFTAKKAIVYILDDKAKAAPKIDAAKITNVQLTLRDVKPPLQIDLTHDAMLSDDKGIAFVGTHEALAKARDIEGTITGKVDGKPYPGDFSYKLPQKADLYLVPGGIYTAADVAANGNTTPALKFKNLMHNDNNVKPGDTICPISKKKAEPECYWIVKGQRYEFCCPPCINQFMKWAHNEPSKIKDAKEYVHKGS